MSRSKVVELKGASYEVRKLSPDVGSFIFMRMMSISMRMMQERAERELEAASKRRGSVEQVAEQPTEEQPAISGEDRVRALAFTVLSGGVEFSDFQFIQTACLKVASKKDENGNAMPIMTDGGVWTKDGYGVRDDVGLVMQLVSEVLVFCFGAFFESTAPGL
jgi:hypothetical protein